MTANVSSSPTPPPSTGAVAWLPVALGLAGAALLILWLTHGPALTLTERVPGTDHAPGGDGAGATNVVLAGKLTVGAGKPSDLAGAWPGLGGPNRTGVDPAATRLARSWPGSGPRELWALDVGEGYAGAAVAGGRVYLMDYDREHKEDAIRCLSLADGKEIWRFAYPVSVKRNHGMSRTIPAIGDNFLVTLGPKCHVACLNATTGELRWGMDLVRQFGTTVPAWYAGQCPLIDEGKVILAPGGPEALVVAVDPQTGQTLWQTPNPKGWKMTHSSVAVMVIGGERTYVYCASGGVVGVSARDGRLLWETADWKISIATVPSPVVLSDGRIFLSGGYNAGSLMLQITAEAGRFTPKTLFKLGPEVFGATQQTPILYNDHIYGARPDGQFVCLDLQGKPVWTSGPSQTFGLGSYMIADGLVFALNDSGVLSIFEASPEKFNRLAQAQVLHGRESWGPMALAGTRLIVRDLTRMACLEVGGQ